MTVYDSRASLKTIDAIFPVRAGNAIRPTPYYELTAGAAHYVRFTMPAEHGIEFSVKLPNGSVQLRLLTLGRRCPGWGTHSR